MAGSSRFCRAVSCELVRACCGVHTVIMRVFAGGSGVMRGGKSDRSSESGVLGVFEPDRLLAIVGGEESNGDDGSMLAM